MASTKTSVDIVLTAEDKASMKLKKVSEGMKETGKTAKVGSEAFGQLAGSFNLPFTSVFSGVAGMSTRLEEMTSAAEGNAKALALVKAAGLAMAVGMGVQLGMVLDDLINRTKFFKEELERLKKEMDVFEKKRQGRESRRQEEIDYQRQQLSFTERTEQREKELLELRKEQAVLSRANLESREKLGRGLFDSKGDAFEGESVVQMMFDTGDIRRAERERIDLRQKRMEELAAREEELLNQKQQDERSNNEKLRKSSQDFWADMKKGMEEQYKAEKKAEEEKQKKETQLLEKKKKEAEAERKKAESVKEKRKQRAEGKADLLPKFIRNLLGKEGEGNQTKDDAFESFIKGFGKEIDKIDLDDLSLIRQMEGEGNQTKNDAFESFIKGFGKEIDKIDLGPGFVGKLEGEGNRFLQTGKSIKSPPEEQTAKNTEQISKGIDEVKEGINVLSGIFTGAVGEGASISNALSVFVKNPSEGAATEGV